MSDPAGNVDDRLSYGGIWVWTVEDVAVSMAGLSRRSAGMARIGPVFTPPDCRGHGYGAVVTAAATAAALDAGAAEVCLFTDIANDTTNRL